MPDSAMQELDRDADAKTQVDDLPNPGKPPEIRLVGHSSLFYWWPVWLISLALGAISMSQGEAVRVEGPDVERIIASNGYGLAFVAALLAVILFTNVKMRGLASITALLAIAFATLALAYFELLDDIAQAIPELSVHMNAGFYFLFGGGLFVIWLVQFALFDRLTVYRIRPGQMIEERVIGSGERSYDASGMQFEQRSEDFFRHRILGFGAGDLRLVVSDSRNPPITISNVLFVERRARQIERLINVKPDQMRG